MRLKTFIATYLLFLTVLFSSVGIVSFYLNNSQIALLKDTSNAQFQTALSSLNRDIAILWERDNGPEFFYEAIVTLVRGYARYYARHNIEISLIDTRHSVNEQEEAQIIFESFDEKSFIVITGFLLEPFEHFMLEYRLDITDNITEMRNIQSTLLFSAIIFSVLAAIGLYLILCSIFKPLTAISKASRKIAGGEYSERIIVKNNSELAQVAIDFNKMAERVEQQIILLEEETENKQQFIDNFAHEMRTPLTAIFGYAEYMQRAVLEEGETAELSARIMNRANYLKKIANSLLDLSMLRDYVPNKRGISIQHLFDDITQTVNAQMESAGVEFRCLSEVDVIEGQEDLIKSLLLNLCLNSLKACTSSGGIISLDARHENENIVLSVSDNGCGIPADAIENVTEPFYRVDKVRNQKDSGAGLGLSLCLKIAEVHGAKMVIESTTQVGTTVRVVFL
jgi:signal transduction histidine kinase